MMIHLQKFITKINPSDSDVPRGMREYYYYLMIMILCGFETKIIRRKHQTNFKRYKIDKN